MAGWDAWRAKRKGNHGAPVPTCSACGAVSVLDPCRSCALAADPGPLFSSNPFEVMRDLELFEGGDDGEA